MQADLFVKLLLASEVALLLAVLCISALHDSCHLFEPLLSCQVGANIQSQSCHHGITYFTPALICD